MGRNRRRGVVALSMIGVFAGGVAAGGLLLSGAPATAAGSGGCTAGSLQGAYGVRFEGRSENLGLFASVSRFKFDGQGDFSAIENYNSEQTGPHRRSAEGTYQMSSNCTFKLLFPSELGHPHEAFGKCVLVASGRQFFCLDVEKGWVTNGTGVKI